jgi:photosystem II stability/assembly factor-like uncharacterized protein
VWFTSFEGDSLCGLPLISRAARLRRRPRHPGYRGREHPRAGQTLVAAAPGAAGASGSDQGAAYVFTNTGGTWTQIAELTVPGTAELGTSLAISTDASTIVLGSPTSNDDNGEAFVFTKSGSTYIQTQELTEPATAAATTALTRAGSPVSAAKKPKPKPTPAVPAFWGTTPRSPLTAPRSRSANPTSA